MISITMTVDNGRLLVNSPYNPAFVRRAHNLAGEWLGAKQVWAFDIRDEQRVRDLCISVYGTDGTLATTLYTMQAKTIEDIYVSRGSVFFGGHQIARATGRDSGARLGDGVIMLDGDISSGGSRVNWTTTVDNGTIIEIKDMTSDQIEMARKSAERYGKWEILEVLEQEVAPLEREIADGKNPLRLFNLFGKKSA